MGKTGKTTLASQMDNALLVAFERGYNAIPGIIAKDITSWSQFKKEVVRELKNDEVKEAFKCIVIDTIDIATELCEKYICSQNGVEKLSDIPWGGGWKLWKKEIEETFRSITQQGYALFFISHAKDKVFKREDGTEYNQIVPSLANTPNEIIRNMADIYGYAHQVRDENGNVSVKLTLRSQDGSIDTGCRFKYIEPEIDFTYQALTKALNDAIDKEAKITNGEYITDEPMKPIDTTGPDFDELMDSFNTLVEKLQEATGPDFGTVWAPRIVATTEKYLGKGKLVTEMNPSQAEQLDLIVSDLTEQVGMGI